MKLITLFLPEHYIKALDQLVAERFFPNRAEAIRAGIREILIEFDRFKVKIDYKPPGEREQAAIERGSVGRRAPRRVL